MNSFFYRLIYIIIIIFKISVNRFFINNCIKNSRMLTNKKFIILFDFLVMETRVLFNDYNFLYSIYSHVSYINIF